MGLYVPYSIYTKISKESHVWRVQCGNSRNDKTPCRDEEDRGGGRSSVFGSHPHKLANTAEVFNSGGYGIFEREKRNDAIRPASRVAKKNRTRQNFLGKRIYVSTVGLDEAVIRKYLRNQEDADQMKDGD